MNNSIFLIFTILIVGCNTTSHEKEVEKFENQVFLDRYLIEVQNSLTIDNGYLFILNNQNCGACDERTISFIKKNFNKEDKKISILAKKDEKIMNELKGINNNSLFLDKDSSFERYGLSFPYSIMFLYENGHPIFWSFMNVEKFNQLKLKLQSFR